MNVNNNQKKAPPPAGNMGLANKTVEGDGTSTKYLDKYLTIYDQWPGVNKLADVKEEHVEGEWLKMFWLNFAYWMAITPLKKEIGEGYLDFSSKETYYKSAKRVLSIKFPNNDFSSKQQDSTDWHKVTKAYFDTECKRSRIENEVEKETRKSEPLYKDLSSSLTVERAKYLGLERVDAKSIALSLIQKAKHYDSGSRLAEFNLNRAALARGGEHSYARYDEGAFDPYFQAPDFDWSIIKQKERQCMLVFCDLNLYMVCPFFSFAVFFLFGGLRRDTVSDLKKPFIFPHLRSIRSDSVANRMTKTLQNNIEFPDRKPAFTSRSMRKGSMTENRLHRDLSPDEEVARSGHTPGGGGPPKNSNAEGYVASTPGMNAPGGLALAGYTNCHMQPVPFNFDCLEGWKRMKQSSGLWVPSSSMMFQN